MDRIIITYFDKNITPRVGDISHGVTIGKYKDSIYIWTLCERCKKGRWVIAKSEGKLVIRKCKSCANKIKGEKERAKSRVNNGTIENPCIGDIRWNEELGKAGKAIQYIYVKCPECARTRWIMMSSHKVSLTKGTNDICIDCNRISERQGKCHLGDKSVFWRGGGFYLNGYHYTYMYPNDPFYDMGKARSKNRRGGRYVQEHRYVMAKHLGRCLHEYEIVHHKNHNKADNHLENLELFKLEYHRGLTIMEHRMRTLEENAKEQSKYIRLLIWHINQLYSHGFVRY